MGHYLKETKITTVEEQEQNKVIQLPTHKEFFLFILGLVKPL